MIWANAAQRKDGDTRLLYNPKLDKWCLIVAGRKYDGGYGVLEYYNDYNEIPELRKEIKNDNKADKGNIESDDSITQGNGDIGDGHRGRNSGVLYCGETSETSKVVGGEPERGGTGDIQRSRSNSNGQDVTHSIEVDNVNARKSLLAQEEKYEKAIKQLKEKVKSAREETLRSEGIDNNSHTPIIESNASDMSIADLSSFVDFKIIKKNAPCKGCINIISKIRLLSAPRLLFR